MSSTDPLSEAREALRDAFRTIGSLDVVERGRCRDRMRSTLARLDALPAPVYHENLLASDFGIPGPRGAWVYLDAEAPS